MVGDMLKDREQFGIEWMEKELQWKSILGKRLPIASGCSPPELKTSKPHIALKPCLNRKRFGNQMQSDLVH